MRVHLAIGLALLGAALSAPTAMAGDGELILSPQWPSSFQEAREEPILLFPGPPLGEPDVSDGPLVPGSTTAGTEHRFRLAMLNPDGSPGPFGPLDLDPERPVTVRVYVSADASHEPAPAPAPVNRSQGAAPELTVQAKLSVAGAETDDAERTRTIVSSPAHDEVYLYEFELDFERERLQAGAGFHVDLTFYQVDEAGERITQPLWNIHTGPQHPTGIVLPTEGSASAEQESLEQAGLGQDATRQTVPTSAVLVLVCSLVVASLAAVRAWRQL